jgi:DNA-directed RNA polymerase alpha subunit
MKEAAAVLVSAFNQVINPTISEDASVKTEGATTSVDDLGLPTRVANALRNAGYTSAEELARATDKDLKNVKNLGGKSLELVDEVLTAKGMTRTK